MSGSVRRYTFVLRLTDRPGGMELIAATFAHRGISITSTLGNDSALDPEGRATVILTFAATPARKEVVKGALSRLSRVVSIVEVGDPEAPALEPAAARQFALVRLAPGTPPPAFPECKAEVAAPEGESGEVTYSLLGPPAAVDAALSDLRASGSLRAATYAVVAV